MTDLKDNFPSRHDAQQAQLERLITGVLRDQPLRRAPASLEARVLARIQQQHAMPWWSAGFVRWPMAARVALLVTLIVIAKITLDVVVWLFSTPTPVTNTVESSVTWAKSTASLFSTLISLGNSLIDAVPPLWIAVGLAFAAGMYIMLFVLGATAYRTLYLNK
jgi:hypothetical protein